MSFRKFSWDQFRINVDNLGIIQGHRDHFRIDLGITLGSKNFGSCTVHSALKYRHFFSNQIWLDVTNFKIKQILQKRLNEAITGHAQH